MDFFGLLIMAGGLALFLYGMKTMGDACLRWQVAGWSRYYKGHCKLIPG